MNQGSALLRKEIEPLEKYLKRSDLVEICINKEHQLICETIKGDWEVIKDKHITLSKMWSLAETLATLSGQIFSEATPLYSGCLPVYGYRIQINMGAMVESGISIAIRIGSVGKYQLEDYMPAAEAKRLKGYIVEGKTIMINAGTGCGKTTFLNSCIEYIPKNLRIITLQDSPELVVPHENHVSLIKSKTSTHVAKLDYSAYINSITRLRPDRILLGEIDTHNTFAFLNLANSGHSGSISTIHSTTPEEAFQRICQNASFGGSQGATQSDLMAYAKSAIDVFVSLSRKVENGKRKFTAAITWEKENG